MPDIMICPVLNSCEACGSTYEGGAPGSHIDDEHCHVCAACWGACLACDAEQDPDPVWHDAGSSAEPAGNRWFEELRLSLQPFASTSSAPPAHLPSEPATL
jgi:hypothetical protein